MAGGGGGDEAPSPAPRPEDPAPTPDRGDADDSASRGLALGLTENNPNLLWSTGARAAPPAGFEPWRNRVERLRPRVYRLVVDWAVLQDDPDRPPDLAKPADGCVRGIPPCGAYAGVRDVLRAVRSQQEAGHGFEVMVVIFGVPAWAARGPRGCERDGTAQRSRPITDRGLEGYRRLVRAVAELAERERVELRWWSPWNEPNVPLFISPQRERCDPDAPALAPPVYTRLARAMRDELRAIGGSRRMVIGELAGVPGASRRAAGVTEFIATLPDDVLCSAAVYAQHAYAERGPAADEEGPVDELEEALDRRPCTRGKPIWVTETGVGGRHAGDNRSDRPAGLRADCRAFNTALARWLRDPRVDVAFQYTVRDDPAFPVGLTDATLTRKWPTYDLLAAWAGDRRPGDPEPPLPSACSKR